MDKDIYDYLRKILEEEDAKKIAALFEKNKEIGKEASFAAALLLKTESVIENNAFPPLGTGVRINGVSAEDLYKKYDIGQFEAYILLIFLSINFEESIEKIKKKEEKRISPPVLAAAGFDGPFLIIRYGGYFIRKEKGGRLFDIPISEETAKKIAEGDLDIRKTAEDVHYTDEELVDIGLFAYLQLWEGLDQRQARNALYRIAPVKDSFYDTLTIGDFPEDMPKDCGYTIKRLFYDKDLSLLESFAYMAWLIEDEEMASRALARIL